MVLSRTSKRAATLASNGNRCRSWLQKAWMVGSFSRRRFQRHREELARSQPPCCVDLLLAGLAHGRVELRVVEHGPGAQLVEHAVRHVGGGGLGEGDAEDAGRIDADSSSRITRCASTWVLPEPASAATRPSRPGPRPRSAARSRHRDDARRAHSKIGSSLVAPVSDHSCTRARRS